jgi:hypothetical protein
MSEENQVNASLQQFQLNSARAAAQAGGGGGGEDAPGTIVDALLRMLGIKEGLNGHSTGGLDSIFSIGSVFSGFSLQTGSIFNSLNTRGGVLAGISDKLGFTFGGSIHDGTDGGVQDAPVDTSGGGGDGGGGGDMQSATLNTIPTAAIHDTGITALNGEFMVGNDIKAPVVKGGSRNNSESTGMGM